MNLDIWGLYYQNLDLVFDFNKEALLVVSDFLNNLISEAASCYWCRVMEPQAMKNSFGALGFHYTQ